MGYNWPYIKQKEGEQPWITYMKHQVFKKNNCVNCIFTGQTGSGKSWAMLSMCEQLDPDFELEGNWFFKAADLFKAFKEYYVDQGKSDKGKIWMYDEAGIDLNNLKFHDEVNKGFNAFFQTARHRNYIFACSVPYMNFISKGVRTLMKTYIKADGWTKKNECRIIPRFMEYNGDYQKFYYKRLVCDFENGSRDYITKSLLPKPSKRLVSEYEKLKKEFTSDLFTDICGRINTFENDKKQKDNVSASSMSLTENQKNILADAKAGLTIHDMAKKYNVTSANCSGHIAAIRKKGITISLKRDKKTGYVIGYDVYDPRSSEAIDHDKGQKI